MVAVISQTLVKNATGHVVGQVDERKFGFVALRTKKNSTDLRGIGIFPTFVEAHNAVIERAAKCGDR